MAETAAPHRTRQAIVEAADVLFYRQGYDATGFADIAKAVGISRGNFYYHFRTKDEILDAVIERRMARTRDLLASYEAAAPDPARRIMGFVRILVANRAAIMAHGCPIGTLCLELAKSDHAALPDAAAIFGLFRDWLAEQFAALGAGDAAMDHALHVLAFSQGTATLATAFRDGAWVDREIARLEGWLQTVAAGCATDAMTVQSREPSQ